MTKNSNSFDNYHLPIYIQFKATWGQFHQHFTSSFLPISFHQKITNTKFKFRKASKKLPVNVDEIDTRHNLSSHPFPRQMWFVDNLVFETLRRTQQDLTSELSPLSKTEINHLISKLLKFKLLIYPPSCNDKHN